MDRTEIKKIIEDTIKKLNYIAEERYIEEKERFLDSRERYVDEIIELGKENDGMYLIRDDFMEDTGIDPIYHLSEYKGSEYIWFDEETEEYVKNGLNKKIMGSLILIN